MTQIMDAEVLLRTDVRAWNERRRAEEFPRPDLRDVDFRKVDLSGADLRDADLSGAKFQDAKLDGADLSGARLHGTSFMRASMVGSKAEDADFTRAVLRDADLTDASLARGKFVGVKWWGAKLGGAELGGSELHLSELEWAETDGGRLEEVVDLDVHTAANARLNQSANIMLRILERSVEELASAGERRCTRHGVVLGTVALLALTGLVAWGSWDWYLGLRPGTAATLLVVSIIPMALLPQVAAHFPMRTLPGIAVAAALLSGLVVAGFSVFAHLVPPVIIEQSLTTIGIGILVVLALSPLKLQRLGKWTAILLVLLLTAGVAAFAFDASGSPWVVPFVFEQGLYPPNPSGSLPAADRAVALVPRMASLFAFVLIAMALRQAVLDWWLLESRIEKGLCRRLQWPASLILVGILPLAGLYPFLGRGSSGHAGEQS